MRCRTVATLAALLASTFHGRLATNVGADCVDTPLTMTFDTGTTATNCYTESGVSVCGAEHLFGPYYFAVAPIVADSDGNTSNDLMNTGESAEMVYTFSMGGAVRRHLVRLRVLLR